MMRHDRLLREHVHDPYRLRAKLHDVSLCPHCGATYRAGRWQWRHARLAAATGRTVCPACRRAADRCPAGILSIDGAFVRDHPAQVMALCLHTQGKAASDHPMSRIIGIEPAGDGFRLTTTDTHLPRRIGHALRSAYHGRLVFHHGKGSTLPRVEWHC